MATKHQHGTGSGKTLATVKLASGKLSPAAKTSKCNPAIKSAVTKTKKTGGASFKMKMPVAVATVEKISRPASIKASDLWDEEEAALFMPYFNRINHR